jgi:prevent-host-death family protein
MPDGSTLTARARKKRATLPKKRGKTPPLKPGQLVRTTISFEEFQSHLDEYLARVTATHIPLTITKKGRPIAVLRAPASPRKSIFGSMKGTVKILGDIVSPLDVEWNALKPGFKG